MHLKSSVSLQSLEYLLGNMYAHHSLYVLCMNINIVILKGLGFMYATGLGINSNQAKVTYCKNNDFFVYRRSG